MCGGVRSGMGRSEDLCGGGQVWVGARTAKSCQQHSETDGLESPTVRVRVRVKARHSAAWLPWDSCQDQA